MPFFDYHIHTKYSSCCKENYTYKDVWTKIKELGLDGFGTADHCNYPSYKVPFIYEQKRMQNQLGLQEKGLVGLEISIYNKKGDLGCNADYFSELDYKIVSEHIHIAKISSGFFLTKAKVKKWLQNYDEKEKKILKEINRVLDMEIKAINNYPKNIFAHIFRFPINIGFVPNILFERLSDILYALEQNSYALEIHASHLHGYQRSKEEAQKSIIAGDNTQTDFYRHLYKKIKEYNIPFALGSDAHSLGRILSRSEWKSFIKKVNISERQLITPMFFRK